jgi:hypothetical protein
MSRQNRYPGINPHLNSFLQHETGWKGFHALHIADIARLLDDLLPEGYRTFPEESLQIMTYDSEALPQKSLTYPDITIYYDLALSSSMPQAAGSAPTLVMPVLEAIDIEDEDISSVVIYQGDKPVTRIEVLSPANKLPGSHAEKYLTKRTETIKSGLRLVEIDYLHERRPIDERMPSYPDKQPKATPYSIIVSDPHPNLETGLMKVYGFGVLDVLPIVDIPLEGEDSIAFDFGAAYQKTFESTRTLYQTYTDYTTEPVNFAAYAPDDQTKIREQMTRIAQQT